MKFIFAYNTNANERREGEISASSREEVFRKLKADGIRPFRVDLAPGLLNRLQSIGWRWFAIVVLLVVAAVAVSFALHVKREAAEVARMDQSPAHYQRTSERHQIYGDPSIMAELESSNFAIALAHPGERFLAYYAQPGCAPSIGTLMFDVDELVSCLTNEIVFVDGEPREVRELKLIVNGMKDELREYLSDEESTAKQYVVRLAERLDEEQRIYDRVKNELKDCQDDALYEERNRSLRDLGLKTIAKPRPKKTR